MLTLALLCTTILGIPPPPGSMDREHPNVVIILADDLGIGDLECYNAGSRIPTPNLNRLREESMLFSNAHSPSAVCTPTRYGLLTGRYCWRTSVKKGVLGGRSPLLVNPARTTIGDVFTEAGYRTACIGKWHLGIGEKSQTDFRGPLSPGPNDCGFHFFYGIPASLDMEPFLWIKDQFAVELPTARTPGSARRWDNPPGGGYWRAGDMAPGFDHARVLPTVLHQSVDWIHRQHDAEPDRPFFLYVPLPAPHTPHLPSDEYQGMSGAGWYGDFVVHVDAVVGGIAEAIEETGQTHRTLFIVTSDNGAHWPAEQIDRFNHRANHDWRGQKADIHEGGHRVPFLARWPGKIIPGSSTDALLCLTDLMATSSALVGRTLQPDEGEDSINQLSLLLGIDGARPPRHSIILHSFRGMFAITRGRWKLIIGRGSGGFTRPHTISPVDGEATGQLYNLHDDPGEQRNLFLEHPDIVDELTAQLSGFRETGRSRPAY